MSFFSPKRTRVYSFTRFCQNFSSSAPLSENYLFLPNSNCWRGRGFFQTYFENATTALRLIHYPSVELLHSGDALGIQPHTDYGFITILAQDTIFGLEIRLPDGGWMPVPYVPGALIINIGDALARWTNDVFNSTPHRVISPLSGIGRYSVAMFFDPDIDARIRCLRKFIDTDHPAQYPAIQYGNYIAERLNKNYPDRAAGQVPS